MHADLDAQQATDLLVRDRRIRQNREDLLHQHLPGLALLSPLDQFLVRLSLGPRLPRRHRLVEQRDDLVQLIHPRLRHQRQQNRITALLATHQRLHRRPPPHRGQEPAPLPRQHRKIQLMSVHPAQELQLVDPRLHRCGGRVRRTPGQPPGHPQPGVLLQQPIQISAHLLGQ
ncbi:hypothetical protein [Streptosporangium sp. NPDC087985]|uniref:hypothetical protein n=1 Tax=Streptosporangium sp. NPDC087985 TaxID=3366196 RepID=UPI0038004B90